MDRRYSKNEMVFVAGWLGLWFLFNLILFHWNPQSVGFLLLSGLTGIIALSFVLFPAGFRRIYAGWMWLTGWVGRINTMVILGILFYLILTPLSGILRLVGKDLLNIRRFPGTGSNWKNREPRETRPEDYERIF